MLTRIAPHLTEYHPQLRVLRAIHDHLNHVVRAVQDISQGIFYIHHCYSGASVRDLRIIACMISCKPSPLRLLSRRLPFRRAGLLSKRHNVDNNGDAV